MTSEHGEQEAKTTSFFLSSDLAAFPTPRHSSSSYAEWRKRLEGREVAIISVLAYKGMGGGGGFSQHQGKPKTYLVYGRDLSKK